LKHSFTDKIFYARLNNSLKNKKVFQMLTAFKTWAKNIFRKFCRKSFAIDRLWTFCGFGQKRKNCKTFFP